MAVRVSCLCRCMLPLKVVPAAGSRCAWHSWIALSVKNCVIDAFFPTDDSKLDLVAAGKRGHLKWHADIRRTLLSTHIREASVKRSLTFPTTLLSPSKTPVIWLYTKASRDLTVPIIGQDWRARVCSVTTRTGPPENLLRRYCGYSSVWIYLSFVAVWVYFTCQNWGKRRERSRLFREALQFSPQFLVSSLYFLLRLICTLCYGWCVSKVWHALYVLARNWLETSQLRIDRSVSAACMRQLGVNSEGQPNVVFIDDSRMSLFL